MMQPCASAAKLRGGGPSLTRGVEAIVLFGRPPPRTVIGACYAAAGPELVLCLLSSSCRPRTQGDAGRRLSGRGEPPQSQQPLPRHRDDQCLSRAGPGVRGPPPVPPRRRALLLEDQEAPGQLDHATSDARVARLGQALLAPPG